MRRINKYSRFTSYRHPPYCREQIIKTDDTEDIVYLSPSDGQLAWQNYSGKKPNIDINAISYEVNEDISTLMLKVDGIVEQSINNSYYMD